MGLVCMKNLFCEPLFLHDNNNRNPDGIHTIFLFFWPLDKHVTLEISGIINDFSVSARIFYSPEFFFLTHMYVH